MKHFYKTILVIVAMVIWCTPSTSLAVSTKVSGISTHSNGRYQIVSNATKLRTGTFQFPGVVSGSNTYNVTIYTSGNATTNGWVYYSDEELAEHATWGYNQGISAFLAQSSDTWTHYPSCANTHTFTRTLVPPPIVVIPNGGGEICPAAFHVINETQTRAQHQEDCQALGSGWDLAEVSGSNASSVNENIVGTSIVANRVLNTSDYEYQYNCSTEIVGSSWPEPAKTLRYNGICFDDIPDTTPYSRALCMDSTPLCNTTDGVCSTSINTCTAGTFSDLNDSPNEYKWECLGIDEGANSPVCKAPIPGGGNNGNDDDSATADCVSNRETVVALGSSPPVILSVLNVDAAANKFDWIFSGTTLADIGSYYTVVTTSPVSLLNTTVKIRHDEGQGAGGPADVTLMCPAVIVVAPPKAYIDKPIVEATDTCTLRWEDVDISGATCAIKNQAGQTIHSITTASSGTYTNISPTDPNNKYFVSCTYRDFDGEIGSIKSEYVSCIKKGELIEI